MEGLDTLISLLRSLLGGLTLSMPMQGCINPNKQTKGTQYHSINTKTKIKASKQVTTCVSVWLILNKDDYQYTRPI